MSIFTAKDFFYTITNISKEKSGNIVFKNEKRFMRAIGPGAMEIGQYGIVTNRNYIFLTSIGKVIVKDGNNVTNIISGSSYTVLKNKPTAIIIDGIDYLDQWNSCLLE